MASVQITDIDLKPVSTKLVNKWRLGNFEAPIDYIAKDLQEEYTHEEMHQMEPEFLLQTINSYLEEGKGATVPELFKEKIYALCAIITNPLEVTQDLTAFVNTVLICNDQPIIPFDADLVPSRYIPRMIDAVNRILPDDEDFHVVFFQDNIWKYIFECYYRENNLIIDPFFGYMEDSFLDNFGPRDVTESIKENMPDMHEIVNLCTDLIEKKSAEIEADITNKRETVVDRLWDELEQDSRLDEHHRLMLIRSVTNYMYVKFYYAITMAKDDDNPNADQTDPKAL